MDSQIISKAIDYAKDCFENDSSGHDFYHTLRVYRTAVRLAQAEGADTYTVALASLLHDVDDRKLSPQTAEGLDNARRFLAENGVDGDTAQKVLGIISEVSYKGKASTVPESIEGKCVQDADRLDAIGAIGIARAFAFGGSRGRKMYDPEIKPQEFEKSENSTSLNHFYEKLFLLKDLLNTDSARKTAEERDRFMHGFVDEFLREWESEDI